MSLYFFVFLKNVRFDRALEAVNNAIKIDPNSPELKTLLEKILKEVDLKAD